MIAGRNPIDVVDSVVAVVDSVVFGSTVVAIKSEGAAVVVVAVTAVFNDGSVRSVSSNCADGRKPDAAISEAIVSEFYQIKYFLVT